MIENDINKIFSCNINNKKYTVNNNANNVNIYVNKNVNNVNNNKLDQENIEIKNMLK